MKITIDSISKTQNLFLKSIKKGSELWLCERSLEYIIIKLFPNQTIIKNKQLVLENSDISFKFFPDYKIIDSKVIIEFNGYRHFSDCLTVCKDVSKKDISEYFGWIFIEIPYFVQLTENITKFLFSNIVDNNLIEDFSNGYPHGFIHPDSLVIGNFCLNGLKRIKNIFECFPKEVKKDCFSSLRKRAILDQVGECMYNPFALDNINEFLDRLEK